MGTLIIDSCNDCNEVRSAASGQWSGPDSCMLSHAQVLRICLETQCTNRPKLWSLSDNHAMIGFCKVRTKWSLLVKNFRFITEDRGCVAHASSNIYRNNKNKPQVKMHWDIKQHRFSGSSLTNWFSIRNLLKHEAKGSLLFWHFKIPACLVFLKQPHIMLNLENNLYKITGYIYCKLRKYSAQPV